MKFSLTIKQSDATVNYAIVRKILLVIGNCDLLLDNQMLLFLS